MNAEAHLLERLLARLRRHPALVIELAEECALPVVAVEAALRALRAGGLVRAVQRGAPPVFTWELS